MKLKWKVTPKATGPYASFQYRSWPHAEDAQGRMLARIECTKEGINRMSPGDNLAMSYEPYLARADVLPDGKMLRVYVANYCEGPIFKWMRSKLLYTNLKDAKATAQRILDMHPEFLPKDPT